MFFTTKTLENRSSWGRGEVVMVSGEVFWFLIYWDRNQLDTDN